MTSSHLGLYDPPSPSTGLGFHPEISHKFPYFRPSPNYRHAQVRERAMGHLATIRSKLGCGSIPTPVKHVASEFGEQLRAVIPVSLYLIFFQLVFFQKPVPDAGLVVMGLVLLIIGLVFFMEGLNLALFPLGELLGSQMPKKLPLWAVLLITFIIGVSVTLAEPAVGVLGSLSSMVEPHEAPYLFVLLNEWNLYLGLAVGAGVGLASVVGILRFIKGWKLKPLIYISTIITLGLTCLVQWLDPRLSTVVGLAWDCGAVTTGPVTVPIILSIGIGVVAHKRSLEPNQESSPLAGFGIVTLASLYPIAAVELLGLVAYGAYPGDSVLEYIQATAGNHTGGGEEEEIPVYEQTPLHEFIYAIRAILPLVLLLLFILKVILREKLPRVILFAEKHTPEPVISSRLPRRISALSFQSTAKDPETLLGTAVELAIRDPTKSLEAYARIENSTDEETDQADLLEADRSGGRYEVMEMVQVGPDQNSPAIIPDVYMDDGSSTLHLPLDDTKEPPETFGDLYSSDLNFGEQSARSAALAIGASATHDLEEVGRFSRVRIFLVGVACVQLGMILFDWGLTFGLTALGASVGNVLPGAFQEVPGESNTPVFKYSGGVTLVMVFGWILGYLATLAEPALSILGDKVTHLTGGVFSKPLLIHSVSFGVGTGLLLGLVKVIYAEFQLIYVILASYAIALVLTFFSSEDFVNVAWDSAAVTTGEITVPFVLTLGLSLGQAVHNSDGFGILTLASVWPIISVLLCGLGVRARASYKAWRSGGGTWTRRKGGRHFGSGQEGLVSSS